MRTLKMALLVVLVLALVIVLTANMDPVNLRLTPEILGLNILSVENVPLAVVIVASVLSGLLIGVLIEFIREGKHRKRLDLARREVGALREENDQLSRKLGNDADDLSLIRS